MLRPHLVALTVLGLARPAAGQDADWDMEVFHRRAVDAVIWGMPVVNYDRMLQEMLTRTAGRVNEVIYWGKPLDWHNQTLTPNPDTLYFMTFLNTREVGPIVIEIPPADRNGSLNGNFVNVWQVPLEDAGLLGLDKGAGLKLLMLPPDYKEKPPEGYTPLQPGTWGSYGLIRSNLQSRAEGDVAKSVAYARQVKVYPLSQAARPPETKFTDVGAVDFDGTIRYDASFFEHLNRVVQAEPWLARDRVMIDHLKTIGIEKGQPFGPNEDRRRVLASAARQAHDELAARYDKGLPAFYEGTHWTFPAPPALIAAAQAGFEAPDDYPVDDRGLAYHYAYIGIKRLGAVQFYMINIKDGAGRNYDGGKTYRLHVPPDVPVEQYWSVTAYDRETHALIRNMPRASRASNAAEVQKNADGSVDVYFGPRPPAGQESNWVPTDPERKFELMFRAYGPTKAFFEKRPWKLADVEEIPAPKK